MAVQQHDTCTIPNEKMLSEQLNNCVQSIGDVNYNAIEKPEYPVLPPYSILTSELEEAVLLFQETALLGDFRVTISHDVAAP